MARRGMIQKTHHKSPKIRTTNMDRKPLETFTFSINDESKRNTIKKLAIKLNKSEVYIKNKFNPYFKNDTISDIQVNDFSCNGFIYKNKWSTKCLKQINPEKRNA